MRWREKVKLGGLDALCHVGQCTRSAYEATRYERPAAVDAQE